MTSKQNDYSEEAFRAAGEALAQIGRAMEGYRDLALDIVGLSIRAPRVRGDEYFLTVRGLDAEGERWVAFHSAFTLTDLMRGLEGRLRSGTLKWKEDKFKR
jgi:hypothetical protein